MKFGKLAAASAVILLALGLGAFAQTATTGQAGASAAGAVPAAGDQTLTDIVTVLARPKAQVELTPGAQPVAASFALSAVDGVDPKLLAGVTANGYARKVAVDNQAVGQVLITTVAKGSKVEAISSEGLTAQFDASNASQLFPERTVEVKGSKSALVAALEKLNATEAAQPQQKKAPADDSTAKSASDGSSNDLAKSYQVPTTVATKADSVESTTVTTEGCPVRVDIGAGAAFVQNKTQTFSDGALSSEGSCSDSGESYTLKKSYLACGDEVDVGQMKAWSKYTLYYVDNGGETHTVSDCTKDDEDFYTVTEDEGQCSIFLDFSKNEAVPQSALIYTNRNGTVVQARGCGASTLTAPIAMGESTNGCTIRHDFAAGKSYEQSMWTYVRNGVTYIASGCTDDGTVYDQQTVYKDASSQYICTPITDLAGHTATLQSRKAITVNGTAQYITECTPDTATKTVYATTDGCTDMSKWTHDISASVSYGQERYYFEDGSSRSYVTACQTSSAAYPQNHTITGYQAHDDQLWAYPLTTVSVTANGSTYTIVNSSVLDGAPQVPYTLDSTVTSQTGESVYEACQGWYKTALSEKWKRPDGTFYLKAIGEGTPVGPRNVCQTNTVRTKNFTTGAGCVQHAGSGLCGDYPNVGPCLAISMFYYYRLGGYFQKVNFETQDVVSGWYDWAGETTSTRMWPDVCTGWVTTEYWSWYATGEGSSYTGLTTAPTNW